MIRKACLHLSLLDSSHPAAAHLRRAVGEVKNWNIVMKNRALVLLLGALLPWFAVSASAQTGGSDDHRYKTTLKTISNLGLDLQRAIKAPHQEKIQGQPIAVELGEVPLVKLEEYPDDPKPLPRVVVSAGFIDLINNVAHAKAIDKIQKGYFQKYILSLAQESGETELKPLPNDTDDRFWTDDMINEQYSNFNSIVGIMIGIKMANHYLGHYAKHASQMNAEPEQQRPLNNFLSPKEWDEAVKVGVRNALDAGCTIEGVLPFFECFEKMPKRPPWTAFFVPDSVKYKDVKKTLEKLQRDFFSGK